MTVSRCSFRCPAMTGPEACGTKVTVSLLLAVPAEVPTPSPSATPDCARTSGLCQWIYEQTGQRWLASGSYYFLLKPAQIALILVLAVVARYLLHRAINRLIRTTAMGTVPTILRPLKERLPSSVADATAIFPERRRQRAQAIGSVLRSAASVTVYSVAGLLILGLLGVNLGPLLASAGIVGVALGFGAQTLVKDLLAGLSMLLEDQYGVGDVVDLGEASGTVEGVGLRVTTIRDVRGVLWYIRNGEITRVGNKSQGWAVVVVDVPIGFAVVDRAVEVIRAAAAGLASDPTYAEDLIEAPEVLGVEQITVEGAVLRTTVKTASDAQWRIGREMRARLTDALATAGIAAQLPNSRVYLRPSATAGPVLESPASTETDQSGPT
jgi:moderate conductance mechanosensitive channel